MLENRIKGGVSWKIRRERFFSYEERLRPTILPKKYGQNCEKRRCP